MSNQRGSVMLVLVLLILLGIAAGIGVYFARQASIQASTPFNLNLKTTPSPKASVAQSPETASFQSIPIPSTVKAYKNSDLGLGITYPGYGLVASTKDKQLEIGECGSKISELAAGSSTSITLDGLANIQVVTWDKQLSGYLDNQGYSSNYALTSIPLSGADEAAKIGAPISPYNLAPAGVSYIYRKGDKIFSFSGSVSSPQGCINPELVKNWGVTLGSFPNLPSTYANWEISSNIKFD